MSVLQCIVKSLTLITANSFYVYLFMMPVMTGTRNLVTAQVVKKLYPELKCKGDLKLEQKQDLKEKVFGILINKLTAVSRMSIDSLCISAFIGLAATGMYSNYYLVLSATTGFSAIVSASMKPSVGNSIALERLDKNYSDMRLFDFMYMALSGWAANCMLCLFQPFIVTWVGEKLMLGMPVVVGLCAYFYILQMGSIRWAYQEGAGMWWDCRYIMIGEAVANVLLNICLCKLCGVAGIVWATVITVFITNFLLCPELLFRVYFRNGKLFEYLKDHTQYIFSMILATGLSYFLCETFFPLGMAFGGVLIQCVLCLSGRLLICTFVSISIFWIIWHRTDRYGNAINWMKFFIKV